MPTVLALGLDPAFVDAKSLAGFSPDVARAFFDAELDRIRTLGHTVERCLVDLGDTAEGMLANHLSRRRFDCVLIGAGLRAPDKLLLFERLLNVVHDLAPGAKLCFNTAPGDSAEAVQRWV